MNPSPATPPVRSLDRFGGLSRCLLRLRENAGEPAWSDADFLQHFAAEFPAWQERPGAVEDAEIVTLARLLGVADEVSFLHRYDDVLQAHRSGRSILVLSARAPLMEAQTDVANRHAMLLEQMDEDAFVVWCPFTSGASDLLPPAARPWWDTWRATGVVLTPAE